MQFKLTLVFSLLFCASLCNSSCNYSWSQKKQPIPVLNSRYTINENDQFCCPVNWCDSECTSDDDMLGRCEHGLADEPCLHCHTCAKGLGEVCGGPYGAIGRCAEGLKCSVDISEFLEGGNATGVCEPKLVKQQYERCGGKHGTCEKGTTCKTVVGMRDIRKCLGSNPPDLKKNCHKDCNSPNFGSPVCATDGRVYPNACYMRQQNCGSDPNAIIRIRKDDNKLCSRHVCFDASPPTNGVVTQDGLTARITCNKGHRLYYSGREINLPRLECSNDHQWEFTIGNRTFRWMAEETKCVSICGTDIDELDEASPTTPSPNDNKDKPGPPTPMAPSPTTKSKDTTTTTTVSPPVSKEQTIEEKDWPTRSNEP